MSVKKRRKPIDHLFVCHMPNGSKAAQAKARRIVKAHGAKEIRFSRQYKIEIDQIVYAMVGVVREAKRLNDSYEKQRRSKK